MHLTDFSKAIRYNKIINFPYIFLIAIPVELIMAATTKGESGPPSLAALYTSYGTSKVNICLYPQRNKEITFW